MRMCKLKKAKLKREVYYAIAISTWELSHSVEKFKHSETDGLKFT